MQLCKIESNIIISKLTSIMFFLIMDFVFLNHIWNILFNWIIKQQIQRQSFIFCVIKYFIFVYCINLLLIYSSKDSWSTDSKKWSPCYSSPSPALWSHQISLKSSSLTTVTTVISSLPDANPCQSRGYKWIWHKM